MFSLGYFFFSFFSSSANSHIHRKVWKAPSLATPSSTGPLLLRKLPSFRIFFLFFPAHLVTTQLSSSLLCQSVFLPPEGSSLLCQSVFLPPEGSSLLCQSVFLPPEGSSLLCQSVFLPPEGSSLLCQSVFLPPEGSSFVFSFELILFHPCLLPSRSLLNFLTPENP